MSTIRHLVAALLFLCCLPVFAQDYRAFAEDIAARLDATNELYQADKVDEAKEKVQMAYFEVFENLEGPIRINISAKKSAEMEAEFGAIRRMMVSVTEPGGTGTQGAVPGFNVGAKTGTARKLVGGRYADNKHMATFIGFAPAEHPRVIVAVNIDEPTQNGYYGGIVAGPVFRDIMAGSLNILGVTPTKPVQQVAAK